MGPLELERSGTGKESLSNTTEDHPRRGRRSPQTTELGKRAKPPSRCGTHTTRHHQNLIRKRAEGLDRHVSGENMHTADGHVQRCSKSQIIRDVQVKTAKRASEHPDTCQNGSHQRSNRPELARTRAAGGTARHGGSLNK